MGNIVYDYCNGVYVNLTNKCPCSCEFCIRYMTDDMGTGESLWLEKEPTQEEVIDIIKNMDLRKFEELVFCGYGEPTERIDALKEIASFVRNNTSLKVRLNTNGLSDLINKRSTAEELGEVLDNISISLNQCTSEKYCELCHPKFGEEAFPALLRFTKDAKKYIENVAMSVVNVISADDLHKCKKIAEELGVPLRIR